MSCNTKNKDFWNTFISIGGGIAAGTAAVAVVVAAPVEIAVTVGLVALTKVAVDANEKMNRCDDPDHNHDDE